MEVGCTGHWSICQRLLAVGAPEVIHQPAGSPASSCHVGRRFVSRRAGNSPLAPRFDAHSSFFFYSRPERKHKSPPISWRSSRGKGGDVSRVPEFISSARTASAKTRLLLKNREDRRGNARFRLAGSTKKRIGTVIGFCLHACHRWHVTHRIGVWKKNYVSVASIKSICTLRCNIDFIDHYVCTILCTDQSMMAA